MDEKIEPNKNGNASEKAKNVSSNLYQPSKEIKQIADKEKGKKAEVILPNSEISESFFEGNKERNIQIPAMQEEIPPKTEMTKNFNHVLSTKAMSQNLGILQKMEKTKTFGRYTILEELGKGGMGRVFQAYDPKVDRKVALKLILSELNANQVELHRFYQEVRAMAKLNHPNIITLYDIGDEDGQPFFTMELIEGPSLKQLICRRTLSITQIVDIMKKVGSAVEYAHSKGIIHRDLKPANVIMTGFDEPKVMDFGLAKLIHEDTQISKSGAIIGTPQYMSPEQAEGKEIDTRTDIYALGAIMYEMLTKETTFTGNSTINLIYKIVNDSPVAPHKINHGVPKELEDICLKALQKKKEDRYPTAQAFVEALSLFEKQRIVKAVSKWDIHGWSKARQNRLVRAAIGLLIMLGLMFFYLKNEYKSLQNKKIEPDNKNSQISFIPEDKSPGDREQTIEKKPLQTISSENQNPDNATAQVDKKLPETNTTAQVDKKLPETNTTAQVDKKHPDTSTTAQVDKKLPETNTNAQVDKKLPDIIPNDSKGIESRKNIPDTNPKIEATQDNDKNIQETPVILPVPLDFTIYHKRFPMSTWEESKGALYSDWYYQIHIKIHRKIYLYGFQIDSSGMIQQIFPKYDDNAVPFSNPLQAGKYQIPPTNSGFILDEKIGIEKFYFLYSESYIEYPTEILNSHLDYLRGKEGRRFERIIEKIYQHK